MQNIIFEAVVVRGNGEGKNLGFPTINLQIKKNKDEIERLKFGVYAVCINIKGRKYRGAAHWGSRSTFDELENIFEIHILDFDENIYDEKIVVEIKNLIRPTKKFDTIESLVEQMKKDVEEVKNMDICT